MDIWEKGKNGFEGLLSAGVPNSVFVIPGKPNYRPTTLNDARARHHFPRMEILSEYGNLVRKN